MGAPLLLSCPIPIIGILSNVGRWSRGGGLGKEGGELLGGDVCGCVICDDSSDSLLFGLLRGPIGSE